MIERVCPVCNTVFRTYPSQNRQTCSRSCARRLCWARPEYAAHMSRAHKGKPSWMRGRTHSEDTRRKIGAAGYSGVERIIASNGYVYVYLYGMPHPRAMNGRAPEQVLIAERVLGRLLRPNEVVHHINQIKTDNRNENLLICTATYHRWLHGQLKRRQTPWIRCDHCGRLFQVKTSRIRRGARFCSQACKVASGFY